MNIPINWDEVNNNIPIFNFNGDIKQAKIVDVYDGDTVKVVFPVSNKLYKFNCRIIGVDTPEIRNKNIEIKKYGIHVRDKLREKILNKVVMVECHDFDKYGRLLIDIKDNLNIKISEWLIENNYAFAYDGGKKKDWNDYLEIINNF